MTLSITRFRRDLFALAEAARNGEQVSFVYKGTDLKIVPNVKPNRLERVTPMQVVNPGISEEEVQKKIKGEMTLAWEKDWSDL